MGVWATNANVANQSVVAAANGNVSVVAGAVNGNVANVAEKEAVGGDQSTTPLQCLVFDQLLLGCGVLWGAVLHCTCIVDCPTENMVALMASVKTDHILRWTPTCSLLVAFHLNRIKWKNANIQPTLCVLSFFYASIVRSTHVFNSKWSK